MAARLAADALVLLHLAFILFVVLGGLLVAWRPRLAWLHLPAAAWGAWIEAAGAICPLTPWENRLRAMAGDAGYPGGFIEHYLIPLVYPGDLTAQHQRWLALGVVLLNLAIYASAVLPALQRRRRNRIG
ncbi:DUF2784 domain-containing protein [Burkholderiaceae bacterium FT117]|uniref:DUF2784 domain-containing protein n=1 Tax=Zeimonas sediminis TaxID=2944268 RepID=UPI002342C164|nr:DUF2784 domain-containing protein [Zeimonas sediminis]MCM5570739.1 DUF2784 domain-containing protein [Zeimonas sediminis]